MLVRLKTKPQKDWLVANSKVADGKNMPLLVNAVVQNQSVHLTDLFDNCQSEASGVASGALFVKTLEELFRIPFKPVTSVGNP